MRTPDEFLPGERLVFRRCPVDGKIFKYQGRVKTFCSSKCNWEFDNNARKVRFLLDQKHQKDLAPRAMLDFVTQTPSRSYSTDIHEIRQELDFLDHSISVHGPDGATLQQGIKLRADKIRAFLETRTYPHRDEIRAYVRSLEILRDTCSEGPEELALRRSQAGAAVWYYRHIHEGSSLARALMCFANACRMLGEKRDARQMARLAHNSVEKLRDATSPNTLLVLHQALALDLRSCTDGYNDCKEEQKHAALLDLADEINTPVIRLQTWHELAGYYRAGGSRVDGATEDALSRVVSLLETIPLSPFYRLTSLRPKIEFAIIHDHEYAIELVQQEYLPLYRLGPRTSQLDNLRRWHQQLGLPFPSDLPRTYDSPMLFYVPRGEL
jgi:hypothetical protein